MTKKIKTLILRTAGTNCDAETARAFTLVGATAELVHINRLIKSKSLLSKYHILAIPGGFTYGDDLESGTILANEINYALKKELAEFIKDGKIIIGICNGFQVLTRMGILPDTNAEFSKPNAKMQAALGLNNSAKFESRWVYLKKEPVETKCVWTTEMPEIIYLPVAHGEGKFIPKDETIFKAMEKNRQIVLRYADETGGFANGQYPLNPNGSTRDIAGVTDKTGRVFGLMPHPERHVVFTQHPNWRRGIPKEKMGTGLQIFQNGVNFVKKI
ncbi:phosphoribosylformylglycinamidine synthase I [Candidatus Omnitrophus magneticus]|uniref:Phosphoribosylformylglycinamidine synthase subunit PurQ n=1 Tax=Candidatus Omnitrophus magneticus TaxID=1609969 RepID=A0A0F0CQS9_9BACT|nr:phosphoribosylformylglycinamidine synthase I [Candidatus Omnitrophus magneticus]